VERERSQGIRSAVSFVLLLVVCGVLGYGAWLVLTRPKPRDSAGPVRKAYTGPDSVGFVSVAGEGVELELLGPGGARTSTVPGAPVQQKIAGSETSVDCPGFITPGGSEAACTSSINVNVPGIGDYTVVARSAAARAVVLNVGWATASQARRGAFDVRVQVPRGGASSFGIIVSREGVTQRSEPRPVSP
jgi:hypothetical protein